MSDPLRAQHVLVSGRVQGVAYRYATANEAERQGLAGWVRNLEDGRVEAVLEGPAEAITAMLRWMERGPPMARVDDLAASEIPAEGIAGFEIRPTADA